MESPNAIREPSEIVKFEDGELFLLNEVSRKHGYIFGIPKYHYHDETNRAIIEIQLINKDTVKTGEPQPILQLGLIVDTNQRHWDEYAKRDWARVKFGFFGQFIAKFPEDLLNIHN